MKKTVKYFSLFILAIFFLASCSSSDKAITGNLIQKRKYNSGYHLSLFSKHQKKQEIHEQELFAEKIEKERKEELKQSVDNKEVYTSTSTSVKEPTKPVLVKKVVLKTKLKKNKTLKKKTVLNFKKEKKIAKKQIKKGVKNLFNSTYKEEEGDGELSAFALVGFIASLLGLILVLLTGFPFLLGTLGVVFSSIGLSQTKKGKTGKGFAIAGLAIGILDILIFWLIVLIIAALIAAA